MRCLLCEWEGAQPEHAEHWQEHMLELIRAVPRAPLMLHTETAAYGAFVPANAPKPSVHHTSLSSDWRTPYGLFLAIEALDPQHNFTVDAAAAKGTHLCRVFITPEDDALAPDTNWGDANDRVWLNPPYGRKLGLFAQKAIEEIVECPGLSVWMLVPARTDTQWWNQLMPYASDIYFLKGRVRFLLPSGDPGGTAPFPSAVIAISCGTGFRRGPNVRFGWTW